MKSESSVQQPASKTRTRRPAKGTVSPSQKPESEWVEVSEWFEVPRPNLDHLITEDDTALDNPFQDLQQDLLRAGLSGWAPPSGSTKFVALTKVGLFRGIHQSAIVPDFLLSLDVELPPDRGIKEDRAYYIWEYGKSPDLVVEVVSNREGKEESSKLVDYALMSIPYYLIYDRRGLLSKDEIRLYELGPGRSYHLRKSHWVPLLGLGFTCWEGSFGGLSGRYLRLCDKEGTILETGDERAVREKARADEEKARADQEKNRADGEKARAERLAQKLRELGIEP